MSVQGKNLSIEDLVAKNKYQNLGPKVALNIDEHGISISKL